MLKPIFPNDDTLIIDRSKWLKAYSLLNSRSTTKAWAYIIQTLRLTVTDKVDTMAVDGYFLYVNPSFIEGLSVRELAFVMAHEAYHVAARHHLRRAWRNPKGWNIAADAVINANLNETFYGFQDPVMPKDGIDKPWARSYTAELAYEKLKKDQQEQQQQQGQDEGDDAQQDGQGQGQGDGQDGDEQQGQGGGNPFEDMKEQGWGDVIDRTDEMSTEEQIEAEEKAAKTVKRAVKVAQQQGHVPGCIKELVPSDEAKQDWREVLRTFASNLIPTDYCWHKPDVRFLSQGSYMPGVIKENVGRIAICVDTSASISQPALEAFASETREIVEEIKPEHVTVIYCDTKVQRVEEFEHGDDFRMEAEGGGGTRFRPAIDRALETDPDAIIYFTDMGARDHGEDPGVPFLWATYDRWGATAPYGEMIDVE